MSNYVPHFQGNRLGSDEPPPKPKKKASAPVSPAPLREQTPHYKAGRDVSQTPNPASGGLQEPLQPWLAPPDPKLAVHGVFHPISKFNQRVDLTVTAFRNRYGYDPTPGLIFDVARSTVPDQQIEKLFTGPNSKQATFLNQFKPGIAANRIYDNGHGKASLQSHLSLQIASVVSEQPQSLAEVKVAHPTVMAGFLPVPKMFDVNVSIGDINNALGKGDLVVTDHGITLSDALKTAKATDMNTEAQLTAKRQGLLSKVNTVKDAQAHLNKLFGTEMPVTGYFNDQWLKAITKWSHSNTYYEEQGRIQAKEAGFSNYADYLEAFKTKQKAVTSSRLGQWFLNALPIYMFNNGASPLAIAGAALHHIGNSKDPIQALSRAGGVTFAGMGGGWQQLESYGAAANSLTNDAVEKSLGHTVTHEEMLAHVRHALDAKPSLLQAITGGHLPEKNTPEWLAILDAGTELAGAMLISHKPILTGERVGAGNLGHALGSRYLGWSSKYAYTYAAQGKVNRVASMLEGGAGGEKLAAFATPLVKQGKMSREQFQQHVAELYAFGKTTVGDKEIHGAILDSLRSRQLKSPGIVARQGKLAKKGLRDLVDTADGQLRGAQRFGATTDTAAKMINLVRTSVAHAAPTGDYRHLMEPRLPERVHDFVLKYRLGDDASADLANQLESKLIHQRARENIPGIIAVQEKLSSLFYAKHPGMRLPAEEPFSAVKMTELPSRFQFPGLTTDQQIVLKGLDRAESAARDINGRINKVASLHRRIILSGAPLPGGEVLFFKHAVSDTTRRILGDGAIVGFKGRKYSGELDDLIRHDVSLQRIYGTFKARTREGETRYMGGSKTFRETFRTSDAGKDGHEYHEATGGYLRRLVTDDIFDAYTRSTPADVTAMVDVVLHNRHYQSMFKAQVAAREAERDALLPPGLRSYVGTGPAARFGVHLPPSLTAEDFALALRQEFDHVGESLKASGLDWSDLRGQWQKVLGGAHQDRKLGKWVYNQGLDIKVKSGEIEYTNKFDDLMLQWIGKLMIPNKWNRGQFAENVFRRQYGELRHAGVEPQDAAHIAMSVSEKQTVYHMLDFANMLQVEQDLRWMSYFATKHRLYVKWLINTMGHNPAAVGAAYEIAGHLDDKQNFQLPFNVWGMKAAIPVARLMFINAKDYSNWSQPLQAGAGVLTGHGLTASWGGSYGNVITRSDQALFLARNAISIQLGLKPATTAALMQGLSSGQKKTVERFTHDYIVSWEKNHKGNPPSEGDVTRWAMWRLMATEAWRANLPLPVVMETGKAAQDPQTLKDLRAFQGILDPQKSRQFLNDHPDVARQFGIYMDPADRIYLDSFWNQYVPALDHFHEQRDALREQYQGRALDAAFFKKRDLVDAAFAATFERLKLEDARRSGTVGTNGAGKDTVTTPGKWGLQISNDPLVDPIVGDPVKFLRTRLGLTDIPKKLLAEHTVNATVTEARKTLDFLSDPALTADANSPFSSAAGIESVKTTRRLLLDFLDSYRNVPSDKLGADSRWYIDKVVNPFWKTAEAKYQAIQNLPSGERDVPYAELRAWKDSLDKPVAHDGITWPSPVQLAWMRLSNTDRKARLSQLAASDPQHLAAYEIRFLTGDKTVTPQTTKGWVTMEKLAAAARADPTLGSLRANEREAIAGWIDKGTGGRPVKIGDLTMTIEAHPGFKKLYDYSLKSRADRLDSMALVKESSFYHGEVGWQSLLAQAKGLVAEGKKKDYSPSAITKIWKAWLGKSTQPGPGLQWVQTNPGFWKEVQLYGPDLIYTLTNEK